MFDDDLPEPKILQGPTLGEMRARRLRILRVMVYFFTVVTLIHKLAVPVVLKFTAVKEAAATHVDAWFLLALSFALLLARSPRITRTISFLAGGLIGYSAHEVIAVVARRYASWLGISHLLSSLPLAALALALLSLHEEARPSWAWCGGIIAFLAVIP